MNWNRLVTAKEIVYFSIMLAISLLLYLFCIISIVGLLYLLIGILIVLSVQGLAIGSLKSNSVKVEKDQFPDIYEKIKTYSMKLGLKRIPAVYIAESGGLLNAYATRFCTRDFIVLYSDIVDMAYEEGENALNFIIAHELAHVKRGHLAKNKFIFFSLFIPFLNTAYSRACEYTCDNIATFLVPEMPTDGLMAILAGKKLYKKVNINALFQNAQKDKDAWVWSAEIHSTHPNLINRLKNITKRQKEFIQK